MAKNDMNPVFMVAKIQYFRGDTDPVEISEPVYYYDPWKVPPLFNMTPAEYCAHIIAMGRNIAATWDVVEVVLHVDRLDFIAKMGGIDVTQEVKEAYDRIYVSRRHEFVHPLELEPGR